MLLPMKVDKLSISLAPDLGDAVRDAARRRGASLSAWLAEAAAAKLRAEALADYLDHWEVQHGAITGDELARAAAELGVSATATDAALTGATQTATAQTAAAAGSPQTATSGPTSPDPTAPGPTAPSPTTPATPPRHDERAGA